MFLTVFHCFSPFYAQEQINPVALFYWATGAICSRWSWQKRDREQIAPVTLNKRAAVWDSLLSLMTKDWQERFSLFHECFALTLAQKKTRDSLEKPLSDFPTLHKVFILPSYFEWMAPFLFLCFSLYSLCLSRSVDVEQVYPFHRWEIEYEHDTHQLWSHSYLHEYIRPSYLL